MICFILLSNQDVRNFSLEMFNDSILQFYVCLTFYLVMCNKPVMGAVSLSMGLGIKAGVLLACPAFFGWV